MKNEYEKSFDLNELKAVSNGDEQFVAEMIGVFIKLIQGGIEEMEIAVKEKNHKVIADCIHKIAPPCRHMGTNKLLNIITRIRESMENSELAIDIETLIIEAKKEMNYICNGLKMEISNNNLIG